MVHHSPLRSRLESQRHAELIKVAAVRGADANALAHALAGPGGLIPRRGRRLRASVAAWFAGAVAGWRSRREALRGTPVTLGRWAIGSSGPPSSPTAATLTQGARGSTPGT